MEEERIRLVLFASSRLSSAVQILIERLLGHRRVHLAGIVVDLNRSSFRRDGILHCCRGSSSSFPASAVYRAVSLVFRWLTRDLLIAWHDLWIRPRKRPTFETFATADTRILYVSDVNSADAVDQVRSLEPDLGAILTARTLERHVTEIPRLGILELFQYDVRKYRGRAQIGYRERSNEDSRLAITVHQATGRSDEEGEIVARWCLPIESFDTDESLELKASFHGLGLFYDAIDAIASKTADFPEQNSSPGAPT